MIEPDGFGTLLRQAAAGDEAAVCALLNRIRPAVERLAAEVWDSDTASASGSDLVQEVMTRAWQRLDQLRQVDGEGDPQAAARCHEWLRQITRRVDINLREHRHAQRRSPPRPLERLDAPTVAEYASVAADLAAAGSSPSQAAQSAEEADRVRAAIERIADDLQRQVIRLRFYDELSLQQISARIGLSYAETRDRFHAGMRFLEAELTMER
jgi:RNA polymerase sigma factor (sigma-70 family)